MSSGRGVLWYHRPALLPAGWRGSWPAATIKIRNTKASRGSRGSGVRGVTEPGVSSASTPILQTNLHGKRTTHSQASSSKLTATTSSSYRTSRPPSPVLSFNLSWEGAVSCLLVQLPGVALAILGISRAVSTHGCTCQGLEDALHASFLAFFPFFLVQLFCCLSFLLSLLVHSICRLVFSQAFNKCAIKFDLLHFLMKKDKSPKAKILAIDSAKVFFGSSPQFCFQLYLIQNTNTVKLSQYLSICFSFLLICKTAFQVYAYERKEEEEDTNESEGLLNRVSDELRKIGAQFWIFLMAAPLLGSSIFFNLGSIEFMTQFLGVHVVFLIILVFISNLVTLIWFENPLQGKTSPTRKLYMSYTNIFFWSRPLESFRNPIEKQVKILQMNRFLVNVTFLVFFLIWTSGRTDENFNLLFPSIIFSSGLLNFTIINKDQILTMVSALPCRDIQEYSNGQFNCEENKVSTENNKIQNEINPHAIVKQNAVAIRVGGGWLCTAPQRN